MDSYPGMEIPIPTHELNKHPLNDWKKMEKWLMLRCLEYPIRNKKFSHIDPVDLMCNTIVSQSARSIREAYDYFKNIANQYQETVKASKKKVNLEQWLKHISETQPEHQQRYKENAAALRAIAGILPPPDHTLGIDFRIWYHELANAMEGIPMTIPGDPGLVALYSLGLTYAGARIRKAHEKTGDPAFKDLLHNLVNCNTFVREKLTGTPRRDDMEVRIIRFLVEQESFDPKDISNPLLIPEEHHRLVANQAPRFIAKKRNLKGVHPRAARVFGAGCKT